MNPRRRSKAVTIVDIAQYLGVSDATVSRALQGKLVSKKTIERVRAAASELGYRPNIGARIMKSGRTGAFGVLTPTITHPYFARMVEMFQYFSDRIDYNVMLGVYEEKPSVCLRFLDQMVGDRRVDGLVLLPIHDPAIFEPLEQVQTDDFPIVVMGGGPPHLHNVSADFGGVQRRIVNHLLDLGHRRIGYLVASLGPSTPEMLQTCDSRFPGMRSALAARGMAIEDIAIEYVRNNYESGFEGARRLLQRSDRPTAIIAMNDQMAVSTLQAARTLGIDVPQQLSVVGTDNIDLSRIFDLTTCDSHLEGQVETAVDILRRTVLDGEEFDEPIHKTLPMELIVRGTTGPAPAA